MAKPDHYAILLAINRYPGLTDLDGPENDARSFRDWLLDPAGGDLDPSHVSCILSSDYPSASDPYDANPTDVVLKKVLNQWLKGPDGWVDRVGERLYLFFAGHGFATGSILDPALFTAQAQMSDPQYIPGYRYASKIQNSGFFDEIVLVMDCCQDVLKCAQVNDPLWSPPDRQRSSQVKFMQAYGAPRGRKAFEQPAGAGPIHGYFTSVFLEALRSAPHDAGGYVTARAVEDTFISLWNDRYLKETGYTPPIQPPRDLRLYRRPLPPAPMAAMPVGPSGGLKVLSGMDLLLDRGRISGSDADAHADANADGWPSRRNMDDGDSGAPPAAPERSSVICEAEDPGVHIRVFDATGKSLGEGFDRLKIQAPPGAYTARFRLGDQSEDHGFSVTAKGGAVHVKQGALFFSSPIPLPQTSSTHEYHYYPAEDLRGRPPAATAQDRILPDAEASLLLFARDSEHPFPQPWSMSPEARSGWRVRRWCEGDIEPQDLPCEVEVDPDRGISSLRLEVPAGTYLLGLKRRFRDHAFWQEMALTIAPRWRTEVYLDSVDDPFTGRRFDLEGASVLARPREAGDPDFLTDPRIRLTEIARLHMLEGRFKKGALNVGSRVADPGNPMLALYRAYALTRAPKPDLIRLGELCDVLRREWTERSADLAILEAWRGIQGGSGGDGMMRFEREAVPMMARGWELLLEMGAATPLSQPAQAQVAMWRIGSPLWTIAQFPEGAKIPAPASGKAVPVDLSRWAKALDRPRSSLGSMQQALRRALIDASEEDIPDAYGAALASVQRAFCVDAAIMDRVVADLWNNLGDEVVIA